MDNKPKITAILNNPNSKVLNEKALNILILLKHYHYHVYSVCAEVCTRHSTHVKVGGQLCKVSSALLPERLNLKLSGLQAKSFLTGPPCWPVSESYLPSLIIWNLILYTWDFLPVKTATTHIQELHTSGRGPVLPPLHPFLTRSHDFPNLIFRADPLAFLPCTLLSLSIAPSQ